MFSCFLPSDDGGNDLGLLVCVKIESNWRFKYEWWAEWEIKKNLTATCLVTTTTIHHSHIRNLADAASRPTCTVDLVLDGSVILYSHGSARFSSVRLKCWRELPSFIT